MAFFFLPRALLSAIAIAWLRGFPDFMDSTILAFITLSDFPALSGIPSPPSVKFTIHYRTEFITTEITLWIPSISFKTFI
jgi:hypothetical protein